MATNTEEIVMRMNLDASGIKSGTNKMLDDQKKAAVDYVGFWKKAINDKDAAEEVAFNRSMARERRLKELRSVRAATALERYSRDWQNAQTMNGSGGWGSVESAAAGAAGGAAREAAGSVSHGAMRESMVLVRELASGNWKKAASSSTILVGQLGGFSSVVASLAAPLAAVAATIGLIKTLVSYSAAQDAKLGESQSKTRLSSQTGKLGGSAENIADDLLKKGAISAAQHERLVAMTNDGNSDHLREAQRFLMGAAEKDRAKDAEKKAEAEHRATAAIQAAERAEEGKAHAAKEAADQLQKQTAFARELKGLSNSAASIRHRGAMIDQESVSIGDLAGRDYVTGLNAQYGKGGRFDLGAGDGPFARAAQGYLLAQKQQQWDITHGNAQFNEKGELVGGAAFEDRQRQRSFHNMLAGAGMETPAMQFADMRESLKEIGKDISDLYQRASTDGIKIQASE